MLFNCQEMCQGVRRCQSGIDLHTATIRLETSRFTTTRGGIQPQLTPGVGVDAIGPSHGQIFSQQTDSILPAEQHW